MANEFIQCRKVCEHVLDKVLGAETTPSGGNASSSSQNSDAISEGSQVPAEDRIELWCNDVVCLLFYIPFPNIISLFNGFRWLIQTWTCVLFDTLFGSNNKPISHSSTKLSQIFHMMENFE